MAKTLNNTREKLLDVAQKLIERHGVNAMSFQDLSDEVGIRKASVHHHFANKAEMIKALTARQIAVFNRELQSLSKCRANGKTKLKRYCDLFVANLESGTICRGCLFGMLMAEFSSVDEDVRRQICRFADRNVDVIETILVEGMNDGSIRPAKTTKAMARMVFAAVEGGMLVARCDGGRARLTQIANQLIRLLSQ